MSDFSTRHSLLARVRDLADHRAWRQFDEQYGDLITRFCLRRGLRLTDAEDIRQSVMFNLARRLPSFDYQPSIGRFRDYLRRIVKNEMIRAHARHKPTTSLLQMEEDTSSDEQASDVGKDDWETEWVHHHYRRAITTVRQTCEPQSMRVFDQLLAGADHATVAADFGISEAAVRKIKQRMKTRLRETIEKQMAAEDQPHDAA